MMLIEAKWSNNRPIKDMVNISEDKLSMFLQQFATVSMACMQEIISETWSYETML